MEREIKFRVFDIENKNMIYLSESQMSSYSLSMNNRFWSLFDGDERGCGNADSSGILMQFTGMKDKNGNKIYEGDVCSYKQDVSNSKERIGFVHYDSEMCFFGLSGIEELSFISTYEIEVIGDIYRNPELIQINRK